MNISYRDQSLSKTSSEIDPTIGRYKTLKDE